MRIINSRKVEPVRRDLAGSKTRGENLVGAAICGGLGRLAQEWRYSVVLRLAKFWFKFWFEMKIWHFLNALRVSMKGLSANTCVQIAEKLYKG